MSQEEEKKILNAKDAHCDTALSQTASSKTTVSKFIKLSTNYNSNLSPDVNSSKKESIILLNTKGKIKNLSGPIQVIDGAVTESANPCELDHPSQGPQRRYECSNYETCLKIAAALNWDSFTCRGCDCQVNENLLWRAQHAVHKDKTAKAICDLPDPRSRKIENGNTPIELKLVADKVGGS